MTSFNEIPKLWRQNLIHMLGAGSHIKKRQHGFRNCFFANVSAQDEDYQSMLEMTKAGLVEDMGKVYNQEMQVFRATELGCKAAGLSKAATKRALDFES